MLIDSLNDLRNSDIKIVVEKRLSEFKSFENKSEEEWFSELCYCLLTANSKAKTAMAIQNELNGNGFLNKSQEEVKNTIIKYKHRFHNNKSKFIVEARKYSNIKNIISELNSKGGIVETREWLVKNIKGISYKESSHFLRNTGHFNVAILDRHILALLVENNYLKTKPKSLNKNIYLNTEQILDKMSKQLKMNQAELDLYLWYMKTGEILK